MLLNSQDVKRGEYVMSLASKPGHVYVVKYMDSVYGVFSTRQKAMGYTRKNKNRKIASDCGYKFDIKEHKLDGE